MRWHVQDFAPLCVAPDTGTADQSGEVFVLIHGTGASSHSWAGAALGLARHGRVVAMDLPGHGFTTAPPRDRMTLTAMSEAIASLLAALDVAPTVMIGHSAGAAIGAVLADRLPTPPRLMIALAGAMFPFRGVASPLFSAAASLLSRSIALPVIVSLLASEGSVARMVARTGSTLGRDQLRPYLYLVQRAGHVRAVIRMMAGWDVTIIPDMLSRYTGQFVAVDPEQDSAIPRGEAARAARLAPNGVCTPWAGLGHLAHEERPDALTSLVDTWI